MVLMKILSGKVDYTMNIIYHIDFRDASNFSESFGC